MKPNTYDSIYSMKSDTEKSPWWKKQGKETLKVLPMTVVSAAVGARVMAGASMMARPSPIHSGDDSANREKQALFIYNNSNSTSLNTFEIVAIVITSVLIIVLSPVICIQCKQWMKWMKGSTEEREIKTKKMNCSRSTRSSRRSKMLRTTRTW